VPVFMVSGLAGHAASRNAGEWESLRTPLSRERRDCLEKVE
jgi:hypothetical protein